MGRNFPGLARRLGQCGAKERERDGKAGRFAKGPRQVVPFGLASIQSKEVQIFRGRLASMNDLISCGVELLQLAEKRIALGHECGCAGRGVGE
jgi:hypothetical protein